MMTVPVTVLDDLTEQELALVDSARVGKVLVCSNGGVDALASSEDAGPRIRAELIRELLLGRHGELDPRGIRLRGARIVGGLELDYVTAVAGLEMVECLIDEQVDLSWAVLPRLVVTGSRIAGIQAAGMRVGGDLVLTRTRVRTTGDTVAVCLRGAHIGGVLEMDEVEVSNDSGPAVVAAGLSVSGNMSLERAQVSGAGDEGSVCLRGARVDGMVTMNGSGFTNTSGPAIFAEGMSVGGEFLLERAQVSGRGHLGAICLVSAHVGDNLYIVDTEVANASGPALYGDGVQVEDTIVVRLVRMSGSGEGGAVWLLGAQLGGLRIVDTEVHNDRGPALFANQLRVQRQVLLERVRMSGTGDHAAIRLAIAQIGGQFDLIDTTITNPAGFLLDLHETVVSGGVRFPAEVVCRDQATCEHIGTVDVKDFGYASLGSVDWRQWLHLIRCHSGEYRPSPYQRLAAVERATGHDGNARHILIAQQHDLRHRTPASLGGWLTRRFHWLWGVLTGYGYRTRRTGLALLIALAVAGLVSLWAGHITTSPGRHAAEHTITSATPHTPCSTVELIGLGLDRGLPLGPTGLRTRCDLDTESAAGQALTVTLWIVQAAVWGLATLALAGYTGLVRKTA